MKKLLTATALTVLVSAMLGCAAAPLKTERYFWPPLPDRPRFEWIQAYSSQLDIEKTPSQRFWAAILGEDPPVTLSKPVEVKSDPFHRKIFVSDLGSSKVVVFDLGKHELHQLGQEEGGPAIVYPLSLALDSNHSIYLLERRYNNVLVFDALEKFTRGFNLEKLMQKPVAMTIDQKRSRLLVADGASNRIFVLSLQGDQQFAFGKGGEGEGEFNLPIAIAINSRDEILVADVFNARIQIFDEKGTFKRKFGRRGDGDADFQLIKSIAVDSDDNIYVVDGRSHKIKVFNRDGEFLLSLGDFYATAMTGKVAPGGFAVPVGIDIDKNDRVYVVDQLNARIQVFQYLSDRYLSANPIVNAPDAQ